MIHTMKDEMVVTNLRLPKSDLIQIRVRAAKLGISGNEYIKRIIKSSTSKPITIILHAKKDDPIWHFPKSAMRLKNKKPRYELSEDDKIIYGV